MSWLQAIGVEALLRQTRVDGFIEHWYQDSEILGHYQVSLLLGIYKLKNEEEPVKKGLATLEAFRHRLARRYSSRL